MGKYLARYKEPVGAFKVKQNSESFVQNSAAFYYLSNYNVDINKIVYDLNVLYKHMGTLRSYLSTDDSFYLNREGFRLMERLDSFILDYKRKNLLYYKALMDALNYKRTVNTKFVHTSVNEIKNIKKSDKFPF